MRPSAILVLAIVAACTTNATVATTSAATPTTRPGPAATTTTQGLEMQLEDCSTPQVTFSPLCETYDLIQSWHVDAPIDTAELVNAAMTGLAGFHTAATEEPPRKLFCAIPDPAFQPLCEELSAMAGQDQTPVGAAVEAAVIEMIETGLDPFSYYLTPEQAESFRPNGVVGGIGLLLDATDAAGSRCIRVTAVCRLTIVFVLPDNPAEAAGLQAGDVIVSIDGQSVDGLGFVEAGANIAADETGTVDLVVDRDGQTLAFTIDRRPVTIPTVEAETSDGGVSYLRIPDFELDVPDLVAQALGALEATPYHTLVVDLRDNPGGYVDAAIAVASQFVDEGQPLFTQADVEQPVTELALPGGLATDKRLIVLVNRGTASAAEITAVALRDSANATVVGEPTYGKNALQLVFDLDNGGQLHLAVAHWVGPDGTDVAAGGLAPDSQVDLPASMSVGELVATALEAAS
jgi:carboxyl-terminal processing protease